jgi:predicted extracellular nuclease
MLVRISRFFSSTAGVRSRRMAPLAAMAIGGMVPSVSSAASSIVINEVYSGGGSTSATAAYKADFAELYNTSSLPISMAGYQLQYSAAGAASTFTNIAFNFGPGSLIGANDYLLINGIPSTGGADNPTPNGSGSGNFAAGSGALRLIDNTGATVDLVGWGTTLATSTTPPTIKFEGTGAAPAMTTTISDSRTGFLDTDDNSKDFITGAPSPTFGTTSTAIAVVVPEPSSIAIAAIGAIGLLRRRTRRTVD